MDTKVATLHMRPAMSVPIEVGPGRTVLVRGGYGQVDDPSAMPTLLCDPRLTLELTERYRSHLPIWLETLERQVRKPQARVLLPGGVELTPPEYLAYHPLDVMHETEMDEVDPNPPEVSANPPQTSESPVVGRPLIEVLDGWDPDERVETD